MTYESLLNDLRLVYEHFIGFLGEFIDNLTDKPLIMLSLFILLALPALCLIFTFFASVAYSSDDMVSEGFNVYRNFKIRENKKKIKREQEAFKREKMNKQIRAYEMAQTFFKNNPNRMSVSIMGFKFYQDGFENKNWSNSKKTRVTKKYKFDSNGELIHSGTTVTSTESYDNTSDLQLLNNFDAD